MTATATVMLAGGGSGGHISPGLAVAERLAERGGVETIFVCSDRAIDARMLDAAGADYRRLPARPPSARPLAALRFLRAFRRSRAICIDLIRSRRVDHVLALGGFVAAPAVAAARRCGTPVTLLNLDRPPGRANRWIARSCGHVWTAIDLPDRPGFAERCVGLPVRRIALAPPADAPGGSPADLRRAIGLAPDRLTLFVTGASQGATSVNAFLTAFVEAQPSCFDGWQIHHVTGERDADGVRLAYRRAGVPAHVEPFRDEMGVAWGAADAAVSRAGANSVAEVAANAVPTLFLPYPYHRDQHQRFNAGPLVERGAALIAEDRRTASGNVRHVGPILARLLQDHAAREAMRGRLREHAPADAAVAIAALLLGATD